jgi:predicted transcriptional regulator
MKAYSEDLRQKIVDALKRGTPKNEAASLFGVSLSSVKRFAKMDRERGRGCGRLSSRRLGRRFRRSRKRMRGHSSSIAATAKRFNYYDHCCTV